MEKVPPSRRAHSGMLFCAHLKLASCQPWHLLMLHIHSLCCWGCAGEEAGESPQSMQCGKDALCWEDFFSLLPV